MGKGEGWGEGEGHGSGTGEGQGSGAAEWNNSLFGCMNNCTNCLCGYFCWCCLSYQNAEKLGKSGCIHTILSCFSPCIPAFLQRNELREQQQIDGSTMGDALASVLCPCCVTVQVANELDSLGK